MSFMEGVSSVVGNLNLKLYLEVSWHHQERGVYAWLWFLSNVTSSDIYLFKSY